MYSVVFSLIFLCTFYFHCIFINYFMRIINACRFVRPMNEAAPVTRLAARAWENYRPRRDVYYLGNGEKEMKEKRCSHVYAETSAMGQE